MEQVGQRFDGMRLVLAVVLATVAAGVLWAGLGALWHFPQPVYLLSPARLLVTLLACGVALAGLRLLWERPRPGLALGGLPVACLWAVSFVSFIGIVTLPLAALGTAVLVILSRRGGGGAGEAIGAGLLVAVSLAVLLLASPWTAAVQCDDGVTRTSTRPFGPSGSRGSGVVGPGGDGRGMFGADQASYTYRCQDGDLVEFRRVR